MQAVVLNEFGPPGVLRIDEAPDPTASPGEVVVELRGAALNRRDTYVRSGARPYDLPLIPGSDGAGIRRDTGEEVVILPSLNWGDRDEDPGQDFEILGGPTDGTYAELIATPEENVFPKPSRLSWEEAAAFPLAGLTAYRALFTRARLREGESVLVLGAGSGVSTFAVQLAHHAGARVFVTSSSTERIERAKELGAEGGVDYTSVDWPERALEETGGGVDLVVDSLGATWPESLRCLRMGGRVVTFGATAGPVAELDVRAFYFGQYSLLGTTMGSASDFAGLVTNIQNGTWSPIVDSIRPLDEVGSAHERMESGEQFGKLVLQIP